MEKNLDNGAWRVGLRDETGAFVDQCSASDCRVGAPGRGIDARASLSLSTSLLRLGIWCLPVGGAMGCANGSSLQAAHAVLYDAQVTIEDPIAPSGISMSTVPAGWTNRPVTVTVSGRDDTGGIASRAVAVNTSTAGTTVDSVCDDTQVNPCPTSVSGPVTVAPSAGNVYKLAPVLTDRAGNRTVGQEQTLRFDNAAPRAPAVELPAGAMPWSTSSDRSVLVTVDSEGLAPVSAIVTQVCGADGGGCAAPRSQAVDAPGSVTVPVILPADGAYAVHAWLRDAAGNEDATQFEQVAVGRDTAAPTVALRTSHVGDVPDGTTVTTSVELADPAPSAGIRDQHVELSDNGAPYQWIGSSFAARSGHTYALRAVGEDAAGNRTVTAAATVRGVSASSPPPPAAAPPPPSPQPPALDQPLQPPLEPAAPVGDASPPRARTDPRLRIRSARLVRGGRLVVTGTVARALDGRRVEVTLRRTTSRTRRADARGRTVVRRGRFAVRIRVPRRLRSHAALRRLRATVTIGQTQTTRAATASRRITRSHR